MVLRHVGLVLGRSLVVGLLMTTISIQPNGPQAGPQRNARGKVEEKSVHVLEWPGYWLQFWLLSQLSEGDVTALTTPCMDPPLGEGDYDTDSWLWHRAMT